LLGFEAPRVRLSHAKTRELKRKDSHMKRLTLAITLCLTLFNNK
jgi:hypothetical protein